MTEAQTERIVSAFESIAKSLETYVTSSFPPEREPLDAEIHQVGDSSEKQPENAAEYAEFKPAEKGRFEKLWQATEVS